MFCNTTMEGLAMIKKIVMSEFHKLSLSAELWFSRSFSYWASFIESFVAEECTNDI
jgi:hypothetical protein